MPSARIPCIEPLERRCLLSATHVRIDCASDDAFVQASGKTFAPDRGFAYGTAQAVPASLSNTADDGLFATYRRGTFGYTFPVANGNYKLKLYMVGAVDRPFNVSAEHQEILRHYNIVAAAGANADVVRAFSVTVRDRHLSLWFQGPHAAATVSAIELIPVSPLGLDWKTVAPAPIKRFESLGATVGGKLYVIAGFDDASIHAIARSDVFDPSTNTWSRIADAPEPLSHAGIATDGPLIYIAGGFVGDWKGANTPVTNHLWIYNTLTNTWSSGTSLPASRGAGALVRVGRKLHFFGGIDASARDSADHWVLDLRKPGRWKQAVPLPDPRNHLGYTVMNGLIYAIGGQHGFDENHPDVAANVYQPTTNRWYMIRNLPAARSHNHNSTFVWNGRVTLLGGDTTGDQSIGDLTQYDSSRKRWVTIGYLPQPRSATVAQLVAGKIVATGGTPTGVDPRADTWILS